MSESEVQERGTGPIKEIRIVYENGTEVYTGPIDIPSPSFEKNTDADADVQGNKAAEEERKKLEAAQTKVAARFRGKQTRKQLEEKRLEAAAEEAARQKAAVDVAKKTDPRMVRSKSLGGDSKGGSRRGGKKSRKPKSKRIRVRKTRRRKH